MQRYAPTGSAAPKPTGGSVSTLDDHAEFILGLIKKQPDMTLDEMVQAMIPGSAPRCGASSTGTASPLKKTLYEEEQKRADCDRDAPALAMRAGHV